MIQKNEQLNYFNNKKEELEFYKSKYESFFKELVQYQLKVQALENSNIKLRKKVSNYLNLNSTKKNNAQTNFLSPSEFKKLWEYCIKTELIESFDFCINEYILIANLCQDIMLLVYEECNNNINNKFAEVLNCLNLSKISKDKKKEIFNNFLPFFQENFNKIFIYSEDFLNIINSKLLSIIVEYNYNKDIINRIDDSENSINKNYNDINNENIILDKIKEKINHNNFSNIIKCFYKICIYMLLHDPILTFDLDNYTNRKLKYFYFNNNDFINVDGFINENSPCIMLLSAPLLKNKFNFYNLKAPIYIVNNPDKNVLDECEKNKSNIKENTEKNNIIKNIINLEGIKGDYINQNKINKTFEENLSNNKSNNSRKSPINHQIFNSIKTNYVKSCQNIMKINGIYTNIKNNINKNNHRKKKNIEYPQTKKDFETKTNISIDKSIKINEKKTNSRDSKLSYVLSPFNNIKKNNKKYTDIVHNYFNNIETINSNNIYKNTYFLSSSTDNIGIGIKEKKENNKENALAQNKNNFNILQNDQSINEIIMGNLNKLKETKLKEYYINNKNKNKNGVRNKNSKYCIKNHIYSKMKNIKNMTNNKMINKKNNNIHSHSQNFFLYFKNKISPSSNNLFRSYDKYNDSSELFNFPSTKNKKVKNYNSFTNLLKLSNINSKRSVNTPIPSSHNTVYNNLVLKGIKNNFQNNSYKNTIIKKSSNNIRFSTNYKISFINNSNKKNIHKSTVNKINFNPLSNRKIYISFIKVNDNKNKENKSEIKQRCSLNNYLEMDNKNKSKKNNSNISTNYQRNSNFKNNINNSTKNKKIQKRIIKNNILKSEGICHNKNFINNCKKIINKEFRNKNMNLKNKYKYKNSKNNKSKKLNNSNNNIIIKEKIYNEENKIFRFSQNDTYIQRTINKSSSPDNNYYIKNKNIMNENRDNNILYNRNSNTTLSNNYLITSESNNNLSSNKTYQQSSQVIKKTKRKVSNKYNIYTNNYINYNKNKMNKHKEKVIKYIKSINIMNKYSTNSNKGKENIVNQNLLGLKQINKNTRYSFQKPINSFPVEIYL